MQISRQVERSLLRRVENNTLGQTMVLLQRNAEGEWPHVPAHADDVIVLFRRVDGIGLAVVDLPCEFAKKRRCGGKGKKKISRDHCRAAGISNQMSREFWWIGIDKRNRCIFLAKVGKNERDT